MSKSYRHKAWIALLSILLLSLCINQNDSTKKETFSNISYKKTEVDPSFTSLDIYTPDSKGSFPIIVYVHGGAWEFGDKKYVSAKPDYFVAHGFVFVSINHRLSPAFKYPAHVQDVADAIAWVHANIARYGGNDKEIFLMGHSTGAHLVSLVSTDERYLRNAGLDLSVIRGTVSLDSDYCDIPLSLAQDESTRPLLEEVFGDDPKIWEDASPINHIEKSKNMPPFLLIYVALREEVTGIQAKNMESRLKESGVYVEIFKAENKTHNSLNSDIGNPYDESTEKIMKFLKSLLKSSFMVEFSMQRIP